MPRKPSSVYVLVEHPTSSVVVASAPPTSLTAWRIPLVVEGDETMEQAKKRAVDQVWKNQHLPIGSMVVAVEDTKVQAFAPSLTLDEIDDPRITDEPDPEPPPTP